MLLLLLTSLFVSSLDGMISIKDCLCEQTYFDKQITKYFNHDDFTDHVQEHGLIGAAKLLEIEGYDKIRNNSKIIELTEKTINSLKKSNFSEASTTEEKEAILSEQLILNPYNFYLPAYMSHDAWMEENKEVINPSELKDSLASLILVKVYLKAKKLKNNYKTMVSPS